MSFKENVFGVQGKCVWGPGGWIGPLAGLRGRAPHEGQGAMPPEGEEMLSFRSQICCFLAQKHHHGFFVKMIIIFYFLFFYFFGQNFLLAEIRDIAEKDIA